VRSENVRIRSRYRNLFLFPETGMSVFCAVPVGLSCATDELFATEDNMDDRYWEPNTTPDQDRIAELEADIEELQADVADYERQLDEMDGLISDAQREISDRDSQLAKLEQENDVLARRIEVLEEQLAALRKAL